MLQTKLSQAEDSRRSFECFMCTSGATSNTPIAAYRSSFVLVCKHRHHNEPRALTAAGQSMALRGRQPLCPPTSKACEMQRRRLTRTLLFEFGLVVVIGGRTRFHLCSAALRFRRLSKLYPDRARAIRAAGPLAPKPASVGCFAAAQLQ